MGVRCSTGILELSVLRTAMPCLAYYSSLLHTVGINLQYLHIIQINHDVKLPKSGKNQSKYYCLLSTIAGIFSQ